SKRTFVTRPCVMLAALQNTAVSGARVDTTTVALVFFLGGSTVLCLSLKLFKIDFKMWQPVLASLAAALCVFIPSSPTGPISLVALLATLKFTTGDTWQNLLLPVFIARLALVPMLRLVGSW